MSKYIHYRWKKDFLSEEWYINHPADDYLSWESKATILEEHLLGINDMDSEAEFYITVEGERDWI